MPTTSTRRTMNRVKHRKANVKAEGMDAFKVGASKFIGNVLDERELTQTEAAYLMQDAPSQISLVVAGKLRGFSAERLLRMLAKLGYNIDIVAARTKGEGRVRFMKAH